MTRDDAEKLVDALEELILASIAEETGGSSYPSSKKSRESLTRVLQSLVVSPPTDAGGHRLEKGD